MYELAYCYDSRSSCHDVYKRSIEPYTKRLLEGCNVNTVILGSTESGKDLLLQGNEHDARAAAAPGIIHHFLEHVFKELHSSSIQVSIAITGCAEEWSMYRTVMHELPL